MTDPSTLSSTPELTILILCRNEEGSIAHCVAEARGFLSRNSINGEVVVDNHSHDQSAARARDAGARVVVEISPGYGYELAQRRFAAAPASSPYFPARHPGRLR